MSLDQADSRAKLFPREERHASKKNEKLSLSLSLYIYIYIHNCIYIYIYIISWTQWVGIRVDHCNGRGGCSHTFLAQPLAPYTQHQDRSVPLRSFGRHGNILQHMWLCRHVTYASANGNRCRETRLLKSHGHMSSVVDNPTQPNVPKVWESMQSKTLWFHAVYL